ncbi:PIN-like protein [Canna indica]|uniref:PIN-like protein n=1 Tax=Canna indica TaxID=4628 RepID=A0AAQ3KT82_9LILI|nr:PIN-like protein [Canna indica]
MALALLPASSPPHHVGARQRVAALEVYQQPPLTLCVELCFPLWNGFFQENYEDPMTRMRSQRREKTMLKEFLYQDGALSSLFQSSLWPWRRKDLQVDKETTLNNDSDSLMVQIIVLQCIIWYKLMFFLFKYRGAKLLIMEYFPDTASSIISFRVDSNIISLDSKELLQTEAKLGNDGKLHVTVRKSTSSRFEVFSRRSHGLNSGDISITLCLTNLPNA